MPQVSYRRPEYEYLLTAWTLVRDCIAGEQKIKLEGKLYLPMPNAEDTSDANKKRYAAYKKRAVFYNATGRTLEGLIGEVFSEDPTLELPNGLNPTYDDSEGGSVTLDQHAHNTLADCVAMGRGGILVDYPKVESGPSSKADLEAGKVAPTLIYYQPEHIINWRINMIAGKRRTSLVVLEEQFILEDDGFVHKLTPQWRVMRIISKEQMMADLASEGPEVDAEGGGAPGTDSDTDKTPVDDVEDLLPPPPETPEDQLVYKMEVWRQNEKNEFFMEEEYYPTDGAGQFFREIPFAFVGSKNNDARPDKAPMYDLAVVNLAHYRNSADYEESCFICGQPTPYMTGLTKTWVDDVLQGEIYLGSRSAIPLPPNAQMGLVQAAPNSMPKEAMDAKERQMVALGAKLVEQKSVQRTAQEATQEKAAEMSVLATCAANVSDAYTRALKWAARFVNLPEDKVEYTLSTQYEISRMTPAERAQLLAEWQAGAITWTEYREQLREANVATEKDDVARAEIESAQESTLRADLLKQEGGKQPKDPVKPTTRSMGAV